jgi:glutamate synthase domain-containing protein 1
LAAPLFCAIFIHNTLQNSLQKSLYFNRQNHQQVGIFSLSSERVIYKKMGGLFYVFYKNMVSPIMIVDAIIANNIKYTTVF